MSEEIYSQEESNKEHEALPVSGMYKNWFLDYASYVILERAVPSIEDGLKPVQRRILHSMKEMDDGRFNKVANIIGQTMQYHPHGDASIGDALVNLGQKDLLIECQGNWGDIRTGDSAAAPRYIEARLSKFALDVVFNAKTTHFQLSYDGRKKEPINLPVKFPLILAQGIEGIAVGLSTKILPHNFIELCEASIKVLKKEEFEIFPDFMTGGQIDATLYNEGLKGSKVRVRAKIEQQDPKTLLVKEIPYGTTTASIIESIIKANDNGKIKIKKVIDNTAKDVEIQIQLAPGTSPDVTISALYAFTDCEIGISPITCVIIDNKPVFLSVKELIKHSAGHTKDLLKWELEILKAELEEKWHFSSLERIFIENRIYRDIEECTTWESVIETIDKGLDPFKAQFYREITRDDIVRLTEIKIKRISKFDAFKADELIKQIEEDLEKVKKNLANLNKYVIDHFSRLIEKYGKGRERKTEIRTFDTIEASNVAIANQKLYVNFKEGFVGTAMKKDENTEIVGDCSDIDDIIAFKKDGKFIVTKIADKKFVGKDILYAAVWKKNDERTTYNLVYLDGKTGFSYAKRFNVTAITRDKEYELTKGEKYSKITYFTANSNSESEIINVQLSPNARAKIKIFDYDFGDLIIKGRSSQGNILTKYPVKKLSQKSQGKSTIGGRKIWYDEHLGRLNTENRGQFLGEFDGDDKITVLYKDGNYKLTNFDLANRYEPNEIEVLAKFSLESVITAVHYVPTQVSWYVKRFKIETTTTDKKFSFITEDKGSKLMLATFLSSPVVTMKTVVKKEEKLEEIALEDFVSVKGWKAIGNKLAGKELDSLKLHIPQEPDEEQEVDQTKESYRPGETVEFEIKPGNDNAQLDLF